MSKKRALVLFYVVALLITVCNLGFFIKDQMFFDMNNLPKGEFVHSSLSPDTNRTAMTYRVDTPKGSAIRVEIVEVNENIEKILTKNIYWDVNKKIVTVGWVDNNIITIDGKPLDISIGDTYDCRRKKSFFQKW